MCSPVPVQRGAAPAFVSRVIRWAELVFGGMEAREREGGRELEQSGTALDGGSGQMNGGRRRRYAFILVSKKSS